MLVTFRGTLFALLLIQALEQMSGENCDQKKRMRLIKRSFKTCMTSLKDLLVEEGCPLESQAQDSDDHSSSVKGTTNAKSEMSKNQPNEKPAKKAEDTCADFQPVETSVFKINCFFSSQDLKNGLAVEKLMKSKLCTSISTMVKQEFEDSNGKSTFKLSNPDQDETNIAKWRGLGFQVFMHIGSWGDTKQLTGQQFSKILSMPKASERLISAVVDQLQKLNFDGLLISWYYPACFQDDCKTGPATDEKFQLNFLKRVKELLTSRAINVKVAVELSFWPENIFLGYSSLEKFMPYIDLLLFENVSPENRVHMKDLNEYKYFSKVFTNFGILENTVRNANLLKKYKFNTKTLRLMELETITPYITPGTTNPWRLMNITNRNLCKLVQSAPQISREMSQKWPLPFINVSTDFYPFNDYDYVKAKVEQYSGPLNFDGVWIRDIWADDFGNECGCGSFPILRAANEAIGRSTCKLPNCPAK